MNINIYIDETSAKKVTILAKKLNKPRNLLIREAINQLLDKYEHSSWSQDIINFHGIKNAPRFEDYRNELGNINEDIF